MKTIVKLRVKLPATLLDEARVHSVDLSSAAETGLEAAIKIEHANRRSLSVDDPG